MGRLCLSPSRQLLPLLLPLLLLLLLPPPAAQGGEAPPQNRPRSPQLEAVLRRLGLTAPHAVHPPPLDVFQGRRPQSSLRESRAQPRARRNPAAPTVPGLIPPTRSIRIPLTQKVLFLEPSDGLFYLNLSREALLEKIPAGKRVSQALLGVLNGQPEAKALKYDLTGAVLPWLVSDGVPKLILRLSSCTTKQLSKEPQPLAAYLQMTYRDSPLRDRRRVRQLGPIRF